MPSYDRFFLMTANDAADYARAKLDMFKGGGIIGIT